jgi:aryl-alcohol dehydrogenase-like predicted oxidoreductase
MTMRYRKLGRSGLVVSEICFGTMTFGGSGGIWESLGALGQKDADALVKDSFDAGVTFFDTADVYAGGLSETILGQSLKNLAVPRDEVVVATKVFGRVTTPAPQNPSAAQKAEIERRAKARNVNGLSRKHIMNAVDASLKRLGLDHIDLYQIHGTDPLTPLEETLGALDDVVKAGKARYIGLCNLSAWRIAKSLWISDKRNLQRFESLQMYYSIAGRDLEREIVPLAQDQELAILPWSPLAGGFLTGKYTREGVKPGEARRAKFDFPPVNLDRAFDCIDAMKQIAQAHDASVAGVALAWLLHKPWVTSVLIGARNASQLKDNLAATSIRLGAEELAALDKVSELPPEYPGWMLTFQSADRAGQV